jgi:hypothetical protein
MPLLNKSLKNKRLAIEPKQNSLNKGLAVRQKKVQIIFAPHFEKKVSKEVIDTFWKNYFSGIKKAQVNKRKKANKSSSISKYNENVLILPLTASLAVTVRKIPIENYSFFKKTFERLNQVIKTHNFKKTEVVIGDIYSIKEHNNHFYVMERVFPSISLKDFHMSYDILEKKFKSTKFDQNRFAPSFFKTLKENKIDPLFLYEKLLLSYKEIENSPLDHFSDTSPNNFIVLGYDPIKEKVKFGFIDYFSFPGSKSF